MQRSILANDGDPDLGHRVIDPVSDGEWSSEPGSQLATTWAGFREVSWLIRLPGKACENVGQGSLVALGA
jgi:hypothetical protein